MLAEKTPALPATALDAVRLLAPIPTPRRDIFAVGKNYREHVAEFGRSGYDQPDRSEALPEHPVVFTKATTSVTGPFDDILPHHGVTSELDYEAELGVIIGRGGRGHLPRGRVRRTCGATPSSTTSPPATCRPSTSSGPSARGWTRTARWAPTRCRADEIDDVTALQVQSFVNGEPRQNAPVKELIFDIPELIAVISAGITLLPGDIIATGTPAGVGIGFDPPKFLVSGDVIEVAITGLGAQRNRIAD